MPRRSTDRHHRFEDLKFVAHALAEHYGRHVVPVPDIDAWLDANEHRRTNALLVVWDRTDAAILTRERDDVEVTAAAPRLGWARRRARDAARPADIPAQEPHTPD